MMIEELKNEYLKWTQQKIELKDNQDFVEIVTPFVDLHHDYISIFFSQENDKYKLTDDGYILDELSMLGIDILSSIKRRNFFDSTLKIFGIDYNESTSELFVMFNSINEYPEMQHRLTQCLIRISDMLLTSRNKVANFFSEDISNFFLESNVYFSESPGYIGRTGRNVTFDFALPRSKKVKPKLIKAINSPTAEAYKEPLLAFVDIQDTKSDHDFIVLANDLNNSIADKFLEPLTNYGVEVLAWSSRYDWVEKLKTS